MAGQFPEAVLLTLRTKPSRLPSHPTVDPGRLRYPPALIPGTMVAVSPLLERIPLPALTVLHYIQELRGLAPGHSVTAYH